MFVCVSDGEGQGKKRLMEPRAKTRGQMEQRNQKDQIRHPRETKHPQQVRHLNITMQITQVI